MRAFRRRFEAPGTKVHWRRPRIRRNSIEAESAAAFIPKRGAVIFGIDEEGHASNILSYADAALSSAQE